MKAVDPDAWNELRLRSERALDSGDARNLDAVCRDLLRGARGLGLPVDTQRDDPHVFLAAPEKLSTATWAQCGGVLRVLLKRKTPPEPEPLRGAIARIAELMPNHR